MGCANSTAATAATAATGPSPSPTLYAYFAEKIAATKHGSTNGPQDIDKGYLRQCTMEDLIAPGDKPSLLELALFTPWFEYLLEVRKCDPRVLYEDQKGRHTTLRLELLGHGHFSLLAQAAQEWDENKGLHDELRQGEQLTNEQWWERLPDSSMRAKFKQPAVWAKFREPAILNGLTAVLGTQFPFPFPVVVIGSMIWAALSYMRERSSAICPELVVMFERAQKTAQSIVKQLHDQMEESLKSEGKLTPLQSLEIDCAQNLEADLENYGERIEEILSSRESCVTKIEKVQEILEKLRSIQDRLLDQMHNRATREALNASTEATREATKAVKVATGMMSKISLRQSNSSMQREVMKSDDVDSG